MNDKQYTYLAMHRDEVLCGEKGRIVKFLGLRYFLQISSNTCDSKLAITGRSIKSLTSKKSFCSACIMLSNRKTNCWSISTVHLLISSWVWNFFILSLHRYCIKLVYTVKEHYFQLFSREILFQGDCTNTIAEPMGTRECTRVIVQKFCKEITFNVHQV